MALPFYYNPATNELELTADPSPLRESLGTRFGLNEISTRAKTLSPTKSHTAESVMPSQFDEISLEEMEDIKKQAGVGEQVKKDPYPWEKPQPPWWEDVHEPAPWDAKDGGRIDMKPGGIVEPGVTHYGVKKGTTTGMSFPKPLPEGAEEWWTTLSDKQKSKYKWNIKDKTLGEIWAASYGDKKIHKETRPNIRTAYEGGVKKAKEIASLTKQGYITLEQFSDEIGASSGALSRALGFREAYEGTPSFIKKFPNLKDLITRSTMGGGSQYYIKRPSEEVVGKLKDYFIGKKWRSTRKGLLNEDTVKRIQYAFNNKALMEYLKNWKEGDKISDNLIKKVFGPEGIGESTIMQLGRVLQGKTDVSGIKKDIKLGNKIIKAMNESSRKGGFGNWQQAAYHYARHEMDTIIKPGAKTFHGYQRLLHKLFKEAGLENFNIDEINALRTGWKSGTSPYTVFTQAIDSRINQVAKRNFDGQSSNRQRRLKLALQSGDKKEARALIEAHNDAIKKFYKNNPGTEGKVKLARLDLREPWEVFGEKRWKSLHPNIQKAITQSWEKVGFSLDVGKGALTQKELADTLQKKIKNKAVRNIALKSIGTMMSLSFGALNQAIGAPIKDIPISEKIPVIGGGELPMTAGKQITDISDLLGMVKNWEEKRKQEELTKKIESQPGSEKSVYDFAEGGDVAKGLTYGTLGTIAAKYPQEVWELAKKAVVKPIAAAALPVVKGVTSAVETGKAIKEKRLPDYDLTNPNTWMHAAFWDWAVKEWGFDQTVKKFGESFWKLSKKDKLRTARNLIARGFLSPKAIQFISSKVAWPLTGIMSVHDAYEDYQERKEFLTPERIAEAQKEEFDKEEPMFAMGGIASLMK